MTLIPDPVTKETLAGRIDIPRVHKDALEKAIGEFSDPGDKPEEGEWKDHFRGHMVHMLDNLVIDEKDTLKD